MLGTAEAKELLAQARKYQSAEVYEEVESSELEMVSMYRPSRLTLCEGDVLLLSMEPIPVEGCHHMQKALNRFYGFEVPIFFLPEGSTIAGVLTTKGKE